MLARNSSPFFDDTEAWSRPAGPGGTAEPGIDVKRILRLRLPIFLITVAVTSPVFVAVAWYLAPVNYVASAEIRFLSIRPRILDTSGVSSDVSRTYEKFVSTQVALIGGTSILSKVLDVPAVRGLPVVAKERDKLGFLRRHVSVRQRSGTELLVVECALPEPQAARQIVDSIVSTYMDYVLAQEGAAGSERLKILASERDMRQVDLESLKAQVYALQARLGPTSSGKDDGVDSEMVLYQENLIKAQDDLSLARLGVRNAEELAARAEAQVEEYRANPNSFIAGDDVQTSVWSDARIVSLTERIAAAKLAATTAASLYVEGSPQIDKAAQSLAALEAELAQTQRMVMDEVLQSRARARRLDVEASRGKVTEAEERVAKYDRLIKDRAAVIEAQSGEFAKLEDLKGKVAQRESLIAEITRQIADIALESKAPAQVSVSSPVSVSDTPNYTSKQLAAILAAGLSIIAGLGVATARELTDQKLHSSQDVARAARVPVIAAIPHTSEDRWLESQDLPFLTDIWPRSISADHLRRVLTSIVYPPDGSQSQLTSVLLTSPTRGDGKTTLACSIAVALAQANRRVLLVDLSYLRPGVEPHFSLEPSIGLGEVLAGQYRMDQVIRPTVIDKLYVLGPGLVQEGLSHQLVSEAMAEFVQEAENNFTHVVFDTPPCLVMSDANLLAPLVDGVILIAGVDTSSRGMIARCMEELDRIGANVFGVVVNGIRPIRGGYFKQNFDLHFNYGSPEPGERETAGAAAGRGNANDS